MSSSCCSTDLSETMSSDLPACCLAMSRICVRFTHSFAPITVILSCRNLSAGEKNSSQINAMTSAKTTAPMPIRMASTRRFAVLRSRWRSLKSTTFGRVATPIVPADSSSVRATRSSLSSARASTNEPGAETAFDCEDCAVRAVRSDSRLRLRTSLRKRYRGRLAESFGPDDTCVDSPLADCRSASWVPDVAVRGSTVRDWPPRTRLSLPARTDRAAFAERPERACLPRIAFGYSSNDCDWVGGCSSSRTAAVLSRVGDSGISRRERTARFPDPADLTDRPRGHCGSCRCESGE